MGKVPAIGIDFGSKSCSVGVYNSTNGKVQIIANEKLKKTTISYVAFKDSECFIGDAALSQVAWNPTNTVFDVKRLIGRKFADIVVQADMNHRSHKVVNVDNQPMIKVYFRNKVKLYAPEEITAMILLKLKDTAEAHLNGKKVCEAVISVPACFTDSQRQAIKDAGAIAGLKVLRLINEPTAAAVAYGHRKNLSGDKNIMILDLGAGTCDVSVVSILDGSFFEVLSTAGNNHLGGEDFTNRLVDHFIQEFKKKHKVDLSNKPRAHTLLKAACEQAKQTLSVNKTATLGIESLYEGIAYNPTITRMQFDYFCDKEFARVLTYVHDALTDAKLDRSDIDDVILVGGSTRIPKIQKMLKEYMGIKEFKKGTSPDESVVYGAAMQAAALSGIEDVGIKELLILDCNPYTLGIKTANGDFTQKIRKNEVTILRVAHHEITTDKINQATIKFEVYEGEAALSEDNNHLGTFEIGIPPALKGTPQIQLSLILDIDCILTVTAKDMADSGGSEQPTLEVVAKKGRLSEGEVGRMAKELADLREEEVRQKGSITKQGTSS